MSQRRLPRERPSAANAGLGSALVYRNGEKREAENQGNKPCHTTDGRHGGQVAHSHAASNREDEVADYREPGTAQFEDVRLPYVREICGDGRDLPTTLFDGIRNAAVSEHVKVESGGVGGRRHLHDDRCEREEPTVLE